MRDEISLEFVNMIREPAKQAQGQSKTAGMRSNEWAHTRSQTIKPTRARRRKRFKRFISRVCVLAVIVGMAIWFNGVLWDNLGLGEAVNSWIEDNKTIAGLKDKVVTAVKGRGLPHPEWTEDYLTVNPYSRPGATLPEINDIFVHYTANPGTNAVQNRSYFEQLKDTKERAASAHFIIGYEGDIILCVPLDEVAYAVKTRNYDSVSIECCYINEDGSFTDETYEALIELLTWLMKEYDLTTDNILRHYDCGGKKCPLYYVENEEQWEQLKEDVAESMK